MSDYDAPEKKLNQFAMRLALLEKVASNVGTLGFVWATVVILGGYAITLKDKDFWAVTAILIMEGARIFMRSNEILWHHQECGDSNCRAWSLIPFMGSLVKDEHVSFVLNSLQILSALVSVGLSAWRFAKHDFVQETEVDTQKNHKAALQIYYSLTVVEAVVFLVEQGYWQYQVRVQKLLKTTQKNCNLKDDDFITVQRYLYDVYDKCLTQSVLEGLKRDMVDYALQWMQSDVFAEQLRGVKALVAFSSKAEKQEETLERISTRPGAVERLLEMVTWKNKEKKHIREAAAELLKLLVGHRTALRVASVTGAVEAIFTLLYDDNPAACTHNNCLENAPKASSHAGVGLLILINMAQYPINCAKIGETRGLLQCLVSFIARQEEARNQETVTAPEEAPTQDTGTAPEEAPNQDTVLNLSTSQEEARNQETVTAPEEAPTQDTGTAPLEAPNQNTVLNLSMELLYHLTTCQGPPGKTLRAQIASVLPSITNLRNILERGNPGIQKMAAATFSNLAMDIEVGQIIGRDGGVLRSLFILFLRVTTPQNKDAIDAAGHALLFLALQNKENCARMLKLKLRTASPVTACDAGASLCSPAAATTFHQRDVIDELVELLEDQQRVYVATLILYCFYDTGVIAHKDDRVAKSFPKVMELFMGKEVKVQEAAIGLVAKILKATKTGYKEELLSCDCIGKYPKNLVVNKLVNLLETHKLPSPRLPRLRRFCLELISILIELDPFSFIPLFKPKNLVGHLDCIAATVSDMENYATACGIGAILLPKTMEDLVQETIIQLHNKISSTKDHGESSSRNHHTASQ